MPELHSLRGLNKLVNLMEFYCGNNVISAAVEASDPGRGQAAAGGEGSYLLLQAGGTTSR